MASASSSLPRSSLWTSDNAMDPTMNAMSNSGGIRRKFSQGNARLPESTSPILGLPYWATCNLRSWYKKDPKPINLRINCYPKKCLHCLPLSCQTGRHVGPVGTILVERCWKMLKVDLSAASRRVADFRPQPHLPASPPAAKLRMFWMVFPQRATFH